MLRLSDVANSATDKSKSQMQFLKNAIQSDQGCNIQFTSVTNYKQFSQMSIDLNR